MDPGWYLGIRFRGSRYPHTEPALFTTGIRIFTAGKGNIGTEIRSYAAQTGILRIGARDSLVRELLFEGGEPFHVLWGDVFALVGESLGDFVALALDERLLPVIAFAASIT